MIAVTIAVQPANITRNVGETVQFTAQVTGTANTAVTWSVQEQGGGQIDATGRYTAPGTAGIFHVMATSVADPTKRDTATVTIERVAIAVSPPSISLGIGGKQQFTAQVNGTSNTAVTWRVREGARGGSITSSGSYAAPRIAGIFYVVATSVADARQHAQARVTVGEEKAIKDK